MIKQLSVLLAALMALGLFAACSSSEEESDTASGDCDAQCNGDADCVEKCVQDLPI